MFTNPTTERRDARFNIRIRGWRKEFTIVEVVIFRCLQNKMSVEAPINTVPIEGDKNAAFSEVHADKQDGSSDTSIDVQKEVFDVTQIDPILAKKMALVNDAIEQIGMTPFQWKIFFLNGFGYAVDSVINTPCRRRCCIADGEASHCVSINSSTSCGAGVWCSDGKSRGNCACVPNRSFDWCCPLGIYSRYHREENCVQYQSFHLRDICLDCGRHAELHLFCSDVSRLATIDYSLRRFDNVRVTIYSAAAGGNYILDATNLIEFLPASYAWLVTFMAIWWAVGYTITGLFAWGFMSNYSCSPDATVAQCTRQDNMGWRYLHITAGAFVLVLSIIRLLIIKMVQTPRWLISQNRDEEVISDLQKVASTYNRPFTLTLEQLQSQGRIINTEKSVWSSLRLRKHFSGLFESKKLAWSTTVIIANWFVIGMVVPLYGVFLPYYLKSRGADVGDNTNYTVWRDYAINQVAGLIGPIIAAVLVETKHIGRRGSLAIGAAVTMAFQFGYTQIKTPAQNVGVSAAITAAS